MLLAILLAAPLALVSPAGSAENSEPVPFQYVPPEGFVPDAETALKITEVILIRIYGETVISTERPLTVSLKDGVWIAQGTMPPNTLGGIAELHISKKDGAILFLSHEQ